MLEGELKTSKPTTNPDTLKDKKKGVFAVGK